MGKIEAQFHSEYRERGPSHPRSAAFRRWMLVGAVAASTLLAQPAGSQQVWIGGSGDLAVGSNWSPAGVPTNSSDVTINNGAPRLDGMGAVNTIVMNGGSFLVDAGGQLWFNNGILNTGSTLTVNAGGELTGKIANDGGTYQNSGRLNGDLSMSGGTNSNLATGVITGNVLIDGTTFTNAGTLATVENQAGSTFDNSGSATTVDSAGTFTNNVGGTVTGNTTITAGTATNDGTLTNIDIWSAATFTNNANATVGAITNDGTTTNAGTAASVNNIGGTFTNTAAGQVTGNTTISDGTLDNAGTLASVDNRSGGTFRNGTTGSAGAVTNAGAAQNSGSVASLSNTGGTFTNLSSGTIGGTATVSGGTLINSGSIADVNNQSGGTFQNLAGSAVTSVTNAGSGSNAGRITTLTNTGGSFDNSGTVTGQTTVTGGLVRNRGSLANVENGAGGTFVNAAGASAGAVTNAGTASNAGQVASLSNTGGTFDNSGEIRAATAISGGTVTNTGRVTTVDNGAAGTFINREGGTATDITNAGKVLNEGSVNAVRNTGGTFDNFGYVRATATIDGGRLTNAGIMVNVVNGPNGMFVNLAPGRAEAVTNSGTAVNAGQVTSVVNQAGTFDNSGIIHETARVEGGRLTNSGAIVVADVREDGRLDNSGGIGSMTNAGTVENTGTIGTLQQNAGQLVNAKAGRIGGASRIDGGIVYNEGQMDAVTVGAGGTFANAGSADAVDNAGSTTNGGTVASLVNRAGTFLNEPNGVIDGTAMVYGGLLRNNGVARGTVEIFTGGLLKGSGLFERDVEIHAGATFAPGNSIATVTIGGNLVIDPGGIYEAEIGTPGVSDLILVGGHATLDGATIVVPASGQITGNFAEYQILQAAGGISASNVQVETGEADLFAHFFVENNTAVLGYVRAGIPFASYGNTWNQRQVGAGVEALGPSSRVYYALAAYDPAAVGSAYDSLSGDLYPTLAGAMIEELGEIRGSFTRRMAGRDQETGPWSEAYGSYRDMRGNGNAQGADVTSGGVLMGIDGKDGRGWTLGGALGYGRQQVRSASSTADVDSLTAGFYVEKELQAFSFRAGGSYSYHDTQMSRAIRIPRLLSEQKADFEANSQQLFAEVGYRFAVGGLDLEPLANVAFTHYRSAMLREKGNDAALSVGPVSQHVNYALIALRYTTREPLDGGLKIGGMIGWQHAFNGRIASAETAFAGQEAHTIYGTALASDVGLAEINASFALSPAATLDLNWRGTYGNDRFDNSGSLGLRVQF